MIKPVPLMLAAMVLITACSAVRDSQFNPVNWFGASRSRAVETAEGVNPLIPARRQRVNILGLGSDEPETPYEGLLVITVTELAVERRPGGAVIRASGIGGKSGLYDPRLIRDESESNATTLTFELRALPGMIGTSGGEFARSVTAAVVLTDQQLGSIRTIRVKGRTNERVTRR
ncbi:MAG: hypothetical protein MK160_05440 [Rhodobacteraceae bacterium]|nr:hypothetical protein [Paracoccaceae bacterium]